MSKTVWKYPVHHDGMGHVVLKLPKDLKVIHYGLQNYKQYIWVEVDPEKSPVVVYFTIVGTGCDIPPNSFHVGTLFEHEFVWHLYQEK